MRVADLPLNDLYERPKITASVEAAILSKENFSSINSNYCEKVCRLKCKNYQKLNLLNVPVDILIIQDHYALNGKWDRREGQQEQNMQSIIKFICDKAGMSGLNVRVTTLLKCKPNEIDFVKGKPPTATTLMKCRPYLHREIENCKPKVIISLSTVVTKALGLKKHSNTGDRGRIANSEFGHVVITLHPRVLTMIRQNASGALWGSDYLNIIVQDFKKAERIARTGFNIPDLAVAVAQVRQNSIKVTRTLEEVEEACREIDALHPDAIVSFDTETTGLDPMSPEARLLCIQFGWRDPSSGNIKAVVIPLWHRENNAYDAELAWDLVKPILEGPRYKVAHNGKFDILYIWHTQKVRVTNLKFDTMLVLHNISSGNQGCYSLKTGVSDYLYNSGLSGYEDLLPALTRPPKAKASDTENEETPAEEQPSEEQEND